MRLVTVSLFKPQVWKGHKYLILNSSRRSLKNPKQRKKLSTCANFNCLNKSDGELRCSLRNCVSLKYKTLRCFILKHRKVCQSSSPPYWQKNVLCWTWPSPMVRQTDQFHAIRVHHVLASINKLSLQEGYQRGVFRSRKLFGSFGH